MRGQRRWREAGSGECGGPRAARRALPFGFLLVFALLLFALAFAVYMFDRPAGSAYLMPGWLAMHVPGRSVFGAAGQWLPSFAHAFAFTVLTAAVWPMARRRRAGFAAGLWCAIGSALEIGQHPALARPLSEALPAWFAAVPVLDHLGAYWLRGGFGADDLIAIVAGCATAGWLVAMASADGIALEDRHVAHR